MLMDLSSCARLINNLFFVAVTDACVVFAVRTSPDEEALLRVWRRWKRLLGSASCSLITHCEADGYFHQLGPVWAKSANFPLVHTQPCAEEIYCGAPEPFAELSVSGELVAS